MIRSLTRKSRKPRHCDSRFNCPGIAIGQGYRYTVLPPRSEPNSSPHWYASAVCLVCVEKEGKS